MPIEDFTPEELLEIYGRGDDGDSAKERIRALVGRLKAAGERARAAEERLGQIETEARTAARAEADTEWGARLKERDEDLAMAGLGVTDPSLRQFARIEHARAGEGKPIADWLAAVREKPTARKGISETLLMGLGLGKGGAPRISEGTGTAGPVTPEEVQQAILKGGDALAELRSRLGS